MLDSLAQLLDAATIAAEKFADDSIAIENAWRGGTLVEFLQGELTRERDECAASAGYPGANTEAVAGETAA